MKRTMRYWSEADGMSPLEHADGSSRRSMPASLLVSRAPAADPFHFSFPLLPPLRVRLCILLRNHRVSAKAMQSPIQNRASPPMSSSPLLHHLPGACSTIFLSARQQKPSALWTSFLFPKPSTMPAPDHPASSSALFNPLECRSTSFCISFNFIFCRSIVISFPSSVTQPPTSAHAFPHLTSTQQDIRTEL